MVTNFSFNHLLTVTWCLNNQENKNKRISSPFWLGFSAELFITEEIRTVVIKTVDTISAMIWHWPVKFKPLGGSIIQIIYISAIYIDLPQIDMVGWLVSWFVQCQAQFNYLMPKPVFFFSNNYIVPTDGFYLMLTYICKQL